MIRIKDKSKCSGCHACASVCPKKCISMAENDEGFLYPVVDKDKCVECGLCNKVCHMLNPQERRNSPCAYACYNLDEEVRSSSSSGGMFTLFAERILELGGVVFGAGFDDNLEVKHFGIDKKEDLHKLRSSKYVQSVIGDAYKQAKDILESGRLVLFSGTPCQISGLQLYLGKSYDGLYTQDIVCHGVPSKKVWKLYLSYLEKHHNSKVDSTIPPSFRNKSSGWLNYSVKVNFENKDVYNEKHGKDLFMSAYLSNALLRASCYKCKLRSLSRDSDITLADFWGVNKVMPDIFDDKGTSLIFVNTKKGKSLFNDIKTKCALKETEVEAAVRYNPSAHISLPHSFKRKKIMSNMSHWDFQKLQYECAKKNYFEKAYRIIRRVLRRR